MTTNTNSTKTDTHALAKAARLSAIRDNGRRSVVSPAHAIPDTPRDENLPDPRLELFHFVMSICSQKSRTALLEANLTFASNELVIMPPVNENYNADYVALRMASPLALGSDMATSYSGATGTDGEGFDPLVVPTLVDHNTSEVIADSRLIALYANKLSNGKLIPDSHKADVLHEVELVDTLPHAGLFYGANPDGDHRPPPIQAGMKDAHVRKIEQIHRHMSALPSGSMLLPAYQGKLLKEEAGRKFVHDVESMRKIIDYTHNQIDGLAKRLTSRGTEWCVGDQFTLADIFWGVSLFRLTYLGYSWMWADHPHVVAYANRAFARPSLRAAAIDWPGHPPGDTIAHIL